jgi:phosphoadenosine phosphosulfate reductase
MLGVQGRPSQTRRQPQVRKVREHALATTQQRYSSVRLVVVQRRVALVDSITNTDAVIVAFSAGKDSLAVLDLCCKRFNTVRAYFMYHVEGLSFQEQIIQQVERRYKIDVLRVPHFALPTILNRSGMRLKRTALKELKITDVEMFARDYFGIEWIASGESKYDSLQRRGMLSVLGDSSIAQGAADKKRKRLYPICDWNRATVFAYLRRQHIPTPSFYRYMKSSLGRFRADELQAVHDHYPADYAKIMKVFPFMEAVRVRGEFYGSEESKPRRSRKAKQADATTEV